ncbi:MAG TPA: hypothetical protein VHE60_08590 [Pyrinomonadaceae bacterium]|nr:hypothetical protein [Pyrinomonadaceae bacterium]
MRRSTIYLFALGLAVVVVTALASAGLVVSAQNSNSSTTATESKPKPKPRKKVAAPAMPPCDNTKQEQTDLSGTYTGKVKHGDQPPMDATLTITGNNFTMTTGSDTHSGRMTAVTTCGYTAVTVMMGDLTPPPPGTNPPPAHPAMSLRAKKVGDSLTLTTVPGEPQTVSFTTGGAAMKSKPRKHKAKAKTTGAATTTPKQ